VHPQQQQQQQQQQCARSQRRPGHSPLAIGRGGGGVATWHRQPRSSQKPPSIHHSANCMSRKGLGDFGPFTTLTPHEQRAGCSYRFAFAFASPLLAPATSHPPC
jgi:hypothetical protein